MADFLTRLAQRVLGEAATVQPYLPPMFAPAPVYVGDPATPLTLESPPEAPTGVVAPAVLPADAPRQPRHTPEMVPLLARPPAPIRAATPVPAPDGVPAVPVVDGTQGPAREAVLPILAPPAPILGAAVPLPLPPAPMPGATPDAPPQPSVLPPVRPLAEVGPAPGAVPVANATPLPLPPRPLPQVDSTPAGGPWRAPLDAAQPERSEAPVIRVTIGRIDVRAVLPPVPPPPRPRPQPAPKMSLDDYLRARQGGRR